MAIINKKLGIRIALFFSFVTVAILSFLYRRSIVFDDAFMFIRYAFNLDVHGIYGWNSNQVSYGCTSIAYVFSTWFFRKIGILQDMNLWIFPKIHSVLYLLLIFLMCFYLAKLILKNKQKYFIEISLLICIILAFTLSPQINGMDTLMAIFTNCILVYAAFNYIKKQTSFTMFLLIASAYFTFLTRPDNLVYATLFPFLLLIVNKVILKKILLFTGVFSFILTLHLYILYIYFGNPMPIPYYVKSAAFYDAYIEIANWNTIKYLAQYLALYSIFIFAIFLGLKKQLLIRLLPLLIPVVITILILMTKVQIMGFNGRYYATSVPFIVVASLLSFDTLKGSIKGFISSNKYRMAFIIVGFILTYVALIQIGDFVFEQKKEKALVNASKYRIKIDKQMKVDKRLKYKERLYWISDLVKSVGDDSLVVAASEHGLISANNLNTKILCLAGLHNTEVLKEKKFNNKVITKSLSKLKPDIIWMPHNAYVALNFNLLNNSEFKEHYEYYHDLVKFGIAIRKDSKFKLQIEDFVNESFHTKKLIPTQYECFNF